MRTWRSSNANGRWRGGKGWAMGSAAERRATRQEWFRRQHWIVRWSIIMAFATAGALWSFLAVMGLHIASGG